VFLWEGETVNEQANRQRLAKAVKAARLRKFKTVDRARIAAGVSRGTWENVERGDSVKEFSLASIEEALDWPEGRALEILAGNTPGDVTREPGRLADLLSDYVARHPKATDDVIAGIIGVPQSTVREWRTQGLAEMPQAAHLRRLAELLGVDESVTFHAVGVDLNYIPPTERDYRPGA
jgi:transcriptional regulator with XRE-family HTH domain